MSKHDLLIIGGGPAGYAAALYGASAGLDIGLVEKGELGGTCLNVGCIPAKEFLESASIYQTVLSAKEFGTEVSGTPSLNMAEVQARKQEVVATLSKGLAGNIKGRGINVYSGVGSLSGEGTVTVENEKSKESQTLNATHILLASGSKPKELPDSTGLKVDGKKVVTSDELLSWDTTPESVAIIGAGAIGVEFASFFIDIGTKVLLVEALDDILLGVDKDIRKVVEKSFTKRGVEIATGAAVTKYENDTLYYGDKKEFKTELVVVCIGRRPYTDLLGLDDKGVKDKGVKLDSEGFVKVNENLETAVSGVYAAGDLIRTPQLAHTGFAEGIFVIQHLLGEEPSPIDYEKTPWGIYCQPEVAFAGLTEQAAKEAGYEVAVSKHSFAANGRAHILGETDGMVKVVSEAESGQILGVHMAGPWVTEQLGAGYLAVNWEAEAQDIAGFVFPHPTLSEMFSEAAISLTGRSLHA